MTRVDRVFFKLLGERIREHREQKRLTQSFLEDEVTTRTISDIESGVPPRTATLLLIARRLGVDIAELLAGLLAEADDVSSMSAAEREARFKRRRGRPKKRSGA